MNREKIDVANNIIILAFEEESFKIESAFNQPTQADNFLETGLEWHESWLIEIEDTVVVLRGVGEDLKI